MKVTEHSSKQLVIKSRRTGNILISATFFGLGSIFCLGILISPEPFFPHAILPLLFVLGSIIYYRRYTHPYVLTFDKYRDKVTYLEPLAGYKNYQEQVIPLGQVEHAEMDSHHFTSGVAYGIVLKVKSMVKNKSEDHINVFSYSRGFFVKKKLSRIIDTINEFLKEED